MRAHARVVAALAILFDAIEQFPPFLCERNQRIQR
jgi:hypothetical protein